MQFVDEDQLPFLRRNTRGFFVFSPSFGHPRVLEGLIAWLAAENMASYLFKVFLQFFLIICKRHAFVGSFLRFVFSGVGKNLLD